MKRTILTMLVLAVGSSFLYAQTRYSAKVSKGRIEVFGVRLQLGMTKADVIEKLGSVRIVKVKDNFWLVGPEDSTSSLQFENGRLTFAGRSWGTKGGDVTGDIAEELFGAVTSMNDEGYSQCDVSTDTRSSPEMKTERVWLRCGDKSIVVVRSSYPNGHTYNEVSEALGVMREVPSSRWLRAAGLRRREVRPGLFFNPILAEHCGHMHPGSGWKLASTHSRQLRVAASPLPGGSPRDGSMPSTKFLVETTQRGYRKQWETLEAASTSLSSLVTKTSESPR
ncbi:MAG TPA: hypothetical protein VKM93_14915 [Terriglobia bacterium]|nr:hypothetical protein [Terriglobia bacterium]